MKKRMLALLMTIVMSLSLLPMSALATEGETDVPDSPVDPTPTYVAQITTGEGEEATISKYETLDEAVAAAADSATIELLADCTTEGMNLEKNLTIQAKEDLDKDKTPTITFTKYGIALWGKSLTFKDCNVEMNGINSTPYTTEWNWMTICANKDASLTLNNVTMEMDNKSDKTEHKDSKGNITYGQHAIYFCRNNKLNLINGSNLTIKNYQQDALEWDGGDGGYNVNITDSTFISDHNRSGFTGTFYATITKSKVDVVNSTGNGSNGSHFIIKDSTVNFNDNTDHGLSAGILSIDNSTVNTLRNGANGIHTNSTLTIKNKSVVDVKNNGCKISSQWTIPGAIHIGSGDSSIDGTSTVAVQNNNGSGILLRAGTFTVSDGASLIITNNTAQKLGFGGGINNRGTISLPVNVTLYNNHAGQAGDDIYNSTNNASISFSPVDFNWALDGDQDGLDCNGVSHAIDGWYDDAENSRWEAHAKPVHVVEFADFEEETSTATVQGALALKAAHALTPLDPGDPGTENWETSKSKSATNLKKDNGKYTSDVTLSLPSSEKKAVTDVVFVLDRSGSSKGARAEIQAMLAELLKIVNDPNTAEIRVGVVNFSYQVDSSLPLTKLTNESLSTIQNAIENDKISGTNIEAGIKAGEAMLDGDNEVSANNKYLVLLTDGISHAWDGSDGSVMTVWGAGTVENASDIRVFNGANSYVYFDTTKTSFSSIYNLLETDPSLKSPYEVPVYISEGQELTAENLTSKDAQYKGKYIQIGEYDTYLSGTEKGIYAAAHTYADAAQKYNCITLYWTSSDYPVAKEFMEWTSNLGPVYCIDNKTELKGIFQEVQKDIFYLLDKGSQVVDVIGHTDDYNFDFVNDAENLILTVGGKKLTVTNLSEPDLFMSDSNETACYGFGESSAETSGGYPYVLHYYANGRDGNSDECFVWDINVPVSTLAPVSLTYTVELTNPKTASGTYGKYNQYGTLNDDGSARTSDLYTNNSATLYPVDSNKNPGVPENFLKPTVSYTVQSSGGGGGGGGSSKPPVLNTEDHFGYIIGYPEHYLTGEACHDQTLMPVKPEGNITRAEVATIFFRMLTDESRAEFWSQTSSYSDVEADDWFNNAICTLSNAGIINGYNDGTFKPNGKITRAEFATIASRFFEYADENIENPFSDVEEGAWYYKYIMAASEMGLINGYPDGTFGPEKLITRAEAVTIVNRTLDRHPDQDHFLKDMLVWVDNMDTSKWYYEAMQEATNSHEYEMKGSGDNKYENWTKMLPIRDWAAFEKEWSDANSASGGEVVK